MSVSLDYWEARAGELILEEPVAQINGEVDLVALLQLSFSLLAKDRHELVANFRGVLRRVHLTKLVLLKCSPILDLLSVF